MSRMVVARRRSRSRTPLRVDADVYCLQVKELERAYLGGPTVARDLPDLYGPSEQSLYDWCFHVWDGLACRFWGQWSYTTYLMRITIFSAVQLGNTSSSSRSSTLDETGTCANESAVAEEDNGIDDHVWRVQSLGMRHYALGDGTTHLLHDDVRVRQAQRRRWHDRESMARLEESMARFPEAIPRTPIPRTPL
jgi:hypothetical protein